jgi:hypothetical protein
MSLSVWIALAVVAVIAVAGGLAQVGAYRRTGSVLTGAQLALRLAMGALLLAVVGLAAYGAPRIAVHGSGLTHAQALSAARHLAAFWTVITLLLVVVVALALADLRQLHATRRRARAAMLRNLDKLQEEVRARAEAGATPPEGPKE